MTEEFLICQNSYGNTTRLKFFYTSKKIPPPVHRQAKQELKIKVAQNWLEDSFYPSASRYTFFLIHIKIPMGLEVYF